MSPTPAAPPAGAGPSFRAFCELGKLAVIELWLGFFAGASLLGRGTFRDPRALAILGLVLLLGVLVIALTCALDDITGARDGTDQANHRAARRWGVTKPLIEGTLDERQALRLAGAAAIAAAFCLGGLLALAWPLPPGLVLTMAAILFLAINYSAGLRLSYHGAGELAVFAGGLGTVLLPFALVTRTVTSPVLVCAALVGLWQAQVVICSNTHDAAGDRATGRLTIAARTTPRGNRVFVTSVFLLGWALGAAALASGAAPPLYALALVPVWALQVFQLWTGVGRGRWLEARRTGFRVVRTGVLALVIANLLQG